MFHLCSGFLRRLEGSGHLPQVVSGAQVDSLYCISSGNDLQFAEHFRNPIFPGVNYAPFMMDTRRGVVYGFKLRLSGVNDQIVSIQ